MKHTSTRQAGPAVMKPALLPPPLPSPGSRDTSSRSSWISTSAGVSRTGLTRRRGPPPPPAAAAAAAPPSCPLPKNSTAFLHLLPPRADLPGERSVRRRAAQHGVAKYGSWCGKMTLADPVCFLNPFQFQDMYVYAEYVGVLAGLCNTKIKPNSCNPVKCLPLSDESCRELIKRQKNATAG